MWETVKSMLTSKKVLASIAGVIVAGAARIGLELDTEAVLAVISPIMLYILAQGMADFGKEANKPKS
jgi:hypothetical protein